MVSTLRSRWLFAVLAVLALLFQAPAHAAPNAATELSVREDASDGMGAVGRVMALVHDEFLTAVPDSTLVEGAVSGMRKYLVDHKLSTAVLPDPKVPGATDVKTLNLLFDKVVARYPSVSSHALTQAAIRGMLASLKDPYTLFMDEHDYKNLMEQMQGGNFGGLGIYIELDEKNNNALTIVEPMEGTPADKAGLKAGDQIVEIDGVSTKGITLEEATKKLRGKAGSEITLTIKRGTEAPFPVKLVRSHIQQRTAVHKILDDGRIGYVKLRVFGENTSAELDEAFRAFDEARVQGYILDLRNNGGGYISTALEVCSKFLPTGSRVVSVVERSTPEAVYSSLPNLRGGKPLVVLVNHFSASASEITAGAIKDLKAGTLLGTKTYGKGSVQKIFPLPDGSALKITTAHYHTPAGKDIHKIGIDPDIVADMDPHNVSTDNDVQMSKAIQVVNEAIAHASQPAVASATSTDASNGPITVKDSNEEFEYVSKMRCDKDGGTFSIVRQSVEEQNGKFIDKVVVKCTTDGEERTLYFDISPMLVH